MIRPVYIELSGKISSSASLPPTISLFDTAGKKQPLPRKCGKCHTRTARLAHLIQRLEGHGLKYAKGKLINIHCYF